jgi:hypothetical protein
MYLVIRKIWKSIKRISGYEGDKKVNFLICGTQKGGTTALDAYLREHPQICMASKKEVHFFDNESYFRNRKPNYSKYHKFFQPNASQKILGEATPSYMYWYSAPRLIWEYNPNMKFIIILRNPITRAHSHWNMLRDLKLERMSFFDALKNERKRCREKLPLQDLLFSYVDRGFYTEQIRRIWHYFPKSQTLFFKNSDLRSKPQPTIEKICDFLEVERIKNLASIVSHSSPYTTPLGNREKKSLKRIFEFEIKSLEQILNWDCSEWLNV